MRDLAEAVIAEMVKGFTADRKAVSWNQLIERFHVSKSTLRRRLQGCPLVQSLNMNRDRFTLKTILKKHMDRNGVWCFHGATFSIHERITLTEVPGSYGEAGRSEAELEECLHLVSKKNLAELARTRKIKLVKIGYKYVYLAREETKHKDQIQRRVKMEEPSGIKLDLEDFESRVEGGQGSLEVHHQESPGREGPQGPRGRT